MITAAIVRELMVAGLAGEQLLSALERIEKSEQPTRSAGAERTARWRERKASRETSQPSQGVTVTSHVTPSPQVSSPSMVSLNNPSLTPPPSSPPSDSSTVAGATRRIDGEVFEEFWGAYPRREGANPKKPAKAVFLAKLKAGATAEEIVAGARACAIRDRDKIGTPFIPQAVKWLRDERWRDYQAQAPPSSPSETSTYGWRPGLPTSAELEAKYGSAAEKGKTDSVGEAPSVDAAGLRPRSANGGVVCAQGRVEGARSLGGVLPSLGLDAEHLPHPERR